MQIKKPSTLSVGVGVGTGVHWQSGVFIFLLLLSSSFFYYHSHHHHHRNALSMVDVAPTYTKGASHSEWLEVT